MSQLAPLLAKLKASGAERVFFAPGEQGLAFEGADKRPVPGGPIAGALILEAVSEILSHDDIEGLSATRPRIVRHEHEGEAFVFEIVRQSNGVALGIREGATKPKSQREPRPVPASDRMRVAPAAPPPDETGTTRRLNKPADGEPSTNPAQAPDVMQVVQKIAMAAAQDVAKKVVLEALRDSPREVTKDSGEILAAAREVAERAARTIAEDVAREMLKKLPAAAAPAPAQATAQAPARSAARGGPARIDTFLRDMIQRKASDLHLTANSASVLRVDGEVHFGDKPLSSDDIFQMVSEIWSERARNDFETLHDADFAYEVPGLARFRVNVFQDRNGTGAVLRQIPIEILSAEKLGLPKACIDLCWLSKGLVLVTGPTGSGKSTTLAAMVDFINKNRSDHIITIEDPVEFVHQNHKCLVNQREVGQHTKSFKNALRAALREDPDIVLVGEMRDLETISIAIETAETGHLVFGTLHTTTAISTVDRIIDQFPSDRQEQVRVMLSESLKGVIAQILCPKIGGGRVAAHEILLGSSAVAALIREGKTFQLASVMQTSKGQGMITMNDSLMSLVQQKKVEPKQAYIKAVDKNGLASMMKNAGINLQL
jgi:twitching motility protein PilT